MEFLPRIGSFDLANIVKDLHMTAINLRFFEFDWCSFIVVVISEVHLLCDGRLMGVGSKIINSINSH